MAVRLFFFLSFLFPVFLMGQDGPYEMADTVRARVLLEEANDLAKKQDLEEALEKAEKAKEIYTVLLGAETVEVADCWNVIGIGYFIVGNYDKAKTAWDTTLTLRLKILGNYHPDVATSYNDLGIVCNDQGKYKKATCYFEKTLEVRLAIWGEQHPQVASSYNNLGVVYDFQGKYEDAVRYYNKALDIRLLTLDKFHPDLAETYFNLGTIYDIQGKFIKAIQFYHEALNIFLEIFDEHHPYIAYCYSNLGISYKELGKYDKAFSYHQKALGMFLNLYDEAHPDIATAYDNLGNIYSSQEKYDKAAEYYDKALDIRSKFLTDLHPNIASSYSNLGLVYHNQGKYDKAFQYQRKALDISLSIWGESYPEVALRYNNLGVLYKSQEKYDRAIECLEKGLDIQSKLNIHHPRVAASCINLGNIYLAKEKYNKAIYYYQKALPSLNFSDINSLTNVNSLPYLIDNLKSISNLYYKKSLNTNNNLLDLYKGRVRLRQAAAALDYQAQLTGNITKTQLAKDAHSLYETALSTNQLLHQATDSSHYLRESFGFSERTKSFFLYEAMKEADALYFAGLPDSLLEREYDLRTDITFYDKQRRGKLAEGLEETDTTVLSVSSKLFDLNREYEALKDLFEREYPDYYRLKYSGSVVGVEDVQQNLLRPNQTLLEYFVGDSSIFAFVVNRDSYHVREIKKDFPLEEWVATFRKANDRDYFAGMVGEYCRVAHDLYLKLVDPVAEHLKAELIIIPDGVLGYLSFEALLVDSVANPNRWKNHHYLLKDKQVSYCYSATLLQEMREKKHKQEPANSFLAFAPYYDGDTALLAGLFRYADEAARQPLRPLPSSGEEVYGIQRLVGGDVYYHEQATEERFTQLAGGYRVLHLATHGKANDKAGDYSFLAFTEQKDSLENELLYVRDLYNLELNADLVVLSACETGIGELRRGEGIVSLARGFTYAGAKSIVTSLWSVADEKTKDIMAAFYQNLKKGLPKDEALRQAKLEYIDGLESHTSAHPFYWSGFIGVGDMRPVGF